MSRPGEVRVALSSPIKLHERCLFPTSDSLPPSVSPDDPFKILRRRQEGNEMKLPFYSAAKPTDEIETRGENDARSACNWMGDILPSLPPTVDIPRETRELTRNSAKRNMTSGRREEEEKIKRFVVRL